LIQHSRCGGRPQRGPDADELHASDYMVYAYLQTAQDRATQRLVGSSLEVFSRFDPTVLLGAAPPSAAYFARAAIPARYCLERHAWLMRQSWNRAPVHFRPLMPSPTLPGAWVLRI